MDRQDTSVPTVGVPSYYLYDTASLWNFVRNSGVKIGPRLCNVGCAAGMDALHLRGLGVTHLVGIEPVPSAAMLARQRYDEVHETNFETWSTDQHFDTIVFADSLEHMVDPENALDHARRLMDPKSGILILSVPNIRHISVLFRLALLGDWRYEPAGIMDKTHLRFFTRHSIVRLLDQSGFETIAMQRWGAMPITRRIEQLAPGTGEFLLSQIFLICKVNPYYQRSL